MDDHSHSVFAPAKAGKELLLVLNLQRITLSCLGWWALQKSRVLWPGGADAGAGASCPGPDVVESEQKVARVSLVWHSQQRKHCGW